MDELQKRLLKQNTELIKQYQHEVDERYKAEKRKHEGLLSSLFNRR